ncbi:aquaporin [Candidatus Saccharibacteria bacterium]|nr:aquaporin [Candidatus Saccharibacteria bacterium]
MATTKSKKTTTKKSSTKPKTAAKPAVQTKTVAANTNPMKGFFARKGDKTENILTIFKRPQIYGALLGEVIGTMLLSTLMFTLGIYQPLYIMFGVLGITMAVYAFSGAHLNPVITVGAMATRRVSAIRGVLYIIAQIIGAWFGLLIVNAFISWGEGAVELPAMATVAEGNFWLVTMIEFMCATIFAFFFARAIAYKRSALTFAVTVAMGFAVALLIAIVVSSNFVQLQNNFMMNPAIAVMYQIFPTSGETFGAIFGDICLALLTYVIFPMLGGVIGFYISEVASRLSGEEVK